MHQSRYLNRRAMQKQNDIDSQISPSVLRRPTSSKSRGARGGYQKAARRPKEENPGSPLKQNEEQDDERDNLN